MNDPENALLLKLKDGDVIIEMFPEDAPNHVARLKELVRAEFYNGLKFHRVIDGFMAQNIRHQIDVSRLVVEIGSEGTSQFVRGDLLESGNIEKNGKK